MVGGGVAGLCTGLALLRRGADVVLYDAADAAESASAVAAGMLAPAFEAALDPVSSGHFELFRTGRDRWPQLTESLGETQALDRTGAIRVGLRGEEAMLEQALARLHAVGAEAERIGPIEVRDLAPFVAGDVIGGVFTPEDWRLDPRSVLQALRRAFVREGGRLERGSISASARGVLSHDRGTVEADAIVIAAGAGSHGLRAAAPELGALEPIKGQLLAFPATLPVRPTIRGAQAYAVAQAGRMLVGATMEAGRCDLNPDPRMLAPLQAQALHLFPQLAGMKPTVLVGVRAGSPDGLPLAGASSRRGVFLATALRRNGWLLAPLVAEIVAAEVMGENPAACAAAFRPDRVTRVGAV